MQNKIGLLSALVVSTMLSQNIAFATEASEFIQNLKGCFSVVYEYVENGKNDQTIDGIYEWITVLPGESETLLQHIGVVENTAFKHWREEWHPNTDGTWYQKVVGPSGDLRYECSAPIELNQWRCAVKNAPKPRRDKHRSDYETLDRENTLQVTSKDWIQVENNIKRDKTGKVVSNEVGWNRYHRVDESHCQAAKEYVERGR